MGRILIPWNMFAMPQEGALFLELRKIDAARQTLDGPRR